MRCPLCVSDNLTLKENTQCCDDCGASFEIIQEKQDFPLDKNELVEMVDKINGGDTDPYTLERILSYLQQDLIYYLDVYDEYRIILGKGTLTKE